LPAGKNMSYFKNIFTTGAVSKTPKRVLKKIAGEVPPGNLRIAVELGAGKGEITRNIIARINSDCQYIAFEINPEFAESLKKDFPGIVVITDDALNFDTHLNQKADLLICSLPLSFFEKKIRRQLLEKIKANVADKGKVIILFHAFWIIPELKEAFPKYKLTMSFHIPPYYIISYTK